MSAQPVQVTRVREFVIPGDPANVLELFEPVGESRWAPGWAPRFIHPSDGAAQTGAVFTRDGRTPSVWMISDYDREARHIVYTVFVPDVRVTRLQIDCLPEADGAKTRARVAYSHTSLGTEAGNAYLRMFTDEHVDHEMRSWQRAIAAHLAGQPFRHH